MFLYHSCPSSCGKCRETSTLHETERFTPGLKVHRDARQDTQHVEARQEAIINALMEFLGESSGELIKDYKPQRLKSSK
ncbi:hypothetical protein PAMP_022984 [Pampus punctatissimus]